MIFALIFVLEPPLNFGFRLLLVSKIATHSNPPSHAAPILCKISRTALRFVTSAYLLGPIPVTMPACRALVLANMMHFYPLACICVRLHAVVLLSLNCR